VYRSQIKRENRPALSNRTQMSPVPFLTPPIEDTKIYVRVKCQGHIYHQNVTTSMGTIGLNTYSYRVTTIADIGFQWLHKYTDERNVNIILECVRQLKITNMMNIMRRCFRYYI